MDTFLLKVKSRRRKPAALFESLSSEAKESGEVLRDFRRRGERIDVGRGEAEVLEARRLGGLDDKVEQAILLDVGGGDVNHIWALFGIIPHQYVTGARIVAVSMCKVATNATFGPADAV